MLPNPPNPAAAARAAMSAAANLTREIEQAILGSSPPEPNGKPDGRRQRWAGHKQARRTELTDGTIEALRELGPEVGMDEIATHIGVSKTVLYRYFADKGDLGVATTVRFFETVLLPQLTEAITDESDEYTLTRTVISVYVQSVADDPHVYRFALAGSPAAVAAHADSERLVAQLLSATIMIRMQDRGGDTTGVDIWSFALVGGLQKAVDWWMRDRPVPVDDLIDYMTMMIWSSIVGIARVNGVRQDFIDSPPPLPDPPLPQPPT